jgi:hypothetical protein
MSQRVRLPGARQRLLGFVPPTGAALVPRGPGPQRVVVLATAISLSNLFDKDEDTCNTDLLPTPAAANLTQPGGQVMQMAPALATGSVAVADGALTSFASASSNCTRSTPGPSVSSRFAYLCSQM